MTLAPSIKRVIIAILSLFNSVNDELVIGNSLLFMRLEESDTPEECEWDQGGGRRQIGANILAKLLESIFVIEFS